MVRASRDDEVRQAQQQLLGHLRCLLEPPETTTDVGDPRGARHGMRSTQNDAYGNLPLLPRASPGAARALRFRRSCAYQP